MIPSSRWFPTGLQNRAAWFDNFNTQFALVGTTLGFTAPDVAAVSLDNDIMQFLAQTNVENDSFIDAARQYRNIMTEGDIGDTIPAYPTNPSGVPPGAPPVGIFERLDIRVKRIRTSPNYTNEIGALLGIMTSTPSPVVDPKPVIKASESTGGFKFEVNVTRKGMSAFKVQVQRAKSNVWTDAAFATSNPCEIVLTPTTAGEPERVLVRAVLLQKNQPIGQPSDPTFVTVNP